MKTIGDTKPKREFTAVASGAISKGDAVVVNSDGSVSVTQSSIAEDIPSGSETQYESGTVLYSNRATAYSSGGGMFVAAYVDSDNSAYGTACACTVSGDTITAGTPTVFNSGSTNNVSIASDPFNSGRFVIAYEDVGDSEKPKAIICTVSGTTFTFGTESQANATGAFVTSVAFNPNRENQLVYAFRRSTSTFNLRVLILTIGSNGGTNFPSGSWGPGQYNFSSQNNTSPTVTFDPNTSDKFLIGFTDIGDSYSGQVVIGDVLADSMTFGSTVEFASYGNGQATSFDPNNALKFVSAFQNGTNQGQAVVGTVSSQTATFGTVATFSTTAVDNIDIAFDPNTSGKFVVAYRDTGNSSYGTVSVGTISGTSISFGTKQVVNTGNSGYVSVDFDPTSAGKFVVTYTDSGNGNVGTAIMNQMAVITDSLTAENFIGFVDNDYADGADATVAMSGAITKDQTGLTAGQKYYVQSDGSLGETAGDPSVVAGTAISATELIIKG